jgi:hypothetical protein
VTGRARKNAPARGVPTTTAADDWRSGRGDICAGSFSYGEKLPERDHYDLYLRRDGTVVAYAVSMELERKFLAVYGKHEPTCRWAYEPPAHCAEVFNGR